MTVSTLAPTQTDTKTLSIQGVNKKRQETHSLLTQKITPAKKGKAAKSCTKHLIIGESRGGKNFEHGSDQQKKKRVAKDGELSSPTTKVKLMVRKQKFHIKNTTNSRETSKEGGGTGKTNGPAYLRRQQTAGSEGITRGELRVEDANENKKEGGKGERGQTVSKRKISTTKKKLHRIRGKGIIRKKKKEIEQQN